MATFSAILVLKSIACTVPVNRCVLRPHGFLLKFLFVSFSISGIQGLALLPGSNDAFSNAWRELNSEHYAIKLTTQCKQNSKRKCKFA